MLNTHTPKAGLGTNRFHNLFFEAEKEGQDFSVVLAGVQAYIAEQHSTLITEKGMDAKAYLKRYITQYLQDKRIAVHGMSGAELVDALYSEMAEFGFLTKYIYGTGIEEININSWRDIEVQYSDGRNEKLTERFQSPQHGINVVRRMLHISGTVLDNASPMALGHLGKNIRIAALKTPIVDEDVGIVASIRIVNPQSMQKQDFVQSGTATEAMLDFLSHCIRYGISVCVGGATSSGKTTLAGWVLSTIPDNKRIYTIENGSRELNLVREVDGVVQNSVIHTLTRESDDARQNIDQTNLLDIALRVNPDVIVVSEMRDAEANAAADAALTGVAVMTTIHVSASSGVYTRMVSLCKRGVDMSDEALMNYVTEAYPIVVFCKQLENKERRLMEIQECVILPDGTREFRTLFQYVVTENRVEDGRFIIEGHHQQVHPISENLAKRFLENGMPKTTLELLRKGD